MIARELIVDTIPPLKTSDTGLKALNWMEEFRVTHLPIVNNVDFLGLISEEDILNLNAPEESLGNHALSLNRPFVTEDQHLYDVLKLFNELKLTVLPVLDVDKHYIGLITIAELVQNLACSGAIKEPGGIIVLELNINDYSLTEVAHLVESEDAKVLSAYVTSHSDSTKMDLTLKINKLDLSRVIATLQRFGYSIKASYHHTDFNDDMRDRFDSLMNFLNI